MHFHRAMRTAVGVQSWMDEASVAAADAQTPGRESQGEAAVGDLAFRAVATAVPVGLPALKRGPKPWPLGRHNRAIARRITELEGEGYRHVAGGSIPEEVIATPGGARGSRRPDITMERPAGGLYRENVGRLRAPPRGGIGPRAPVRRETEALNDLEGATGERPGFTGYN